MFNKRINKLQTKLESVAGSDVISDKQLDTTAKRKMFELFKDNAHIEEIKEIV
jgi:hypothetical protein